MKRFVSLLVIFSLALGSVGIITNKNIAFGANRQISQKNVIKNTHPTAVKKPIHQFISFNDYQVVGLDSNGWNWVKNDEFILPPFTPLDIDMVQTAYGQSYTVNSKSVFLDGTELTAYRDQIQANQPMLQWNIPRFTIPYTSLSAGNHMLTFVVTDGEQKSSTVHVRFVVEQSQTVNIFEGTAAAGAPIPPNTNIQIPGVIGSKRLFASEEGTWKLTRQEGTEIRKATGQNFYTGTLATGNYTVSFDPAKTDTPTATYSLQVGMVDLYQGSDASGQKLSPGQRIQASSAPSIIPLYSGVPGRWWVNGTGQTAVGAKNFNVQVPEKLSGLTLTVNYEPEGADYPITSSVLVEIPGTINACDPTKAQATMDVLMQGNAQSSPLVEKRGVRSGGSTVQLYQKPIYKIWLATAADHLKYSNEEEDGEGPGVWAVENLIVDYTRLNWDHTALELSSYPPGIYKINYYSKRDPNVTWCGVVQVTEDTKPIPVSDSCNASESGVAPDVKPMKLITEDGTELKDGGTILVESEEELSDYEHLKLYATHVESKGQKKIKKGTSTKKDKRYIWVPDLQWDFDRTSFGEKKEYADWTIASSTKVEVVYNDEETLFERDPQEGRNDKEHIQGDETLDLKKIIASNKNKPGKYTLRITNELLYKSCKLERNKSVYDKEINTNDREQEFTTTIFIK